MKNEFIVTSMYSFLFNKRITRSNSKTKRLYLILFLSILCLKSYAQNDFRKNTVHTSIGTIGVAFSTHLTYERLLVQKEQGFLKSYYLTARGGKSAALDFSGANTGSGTLTSIGITGLTGIGKHHFEIGLGFGYFIDGFPENNQENDNGFYPSFTFGYRREIGSSFLFRTGLGLGELAYFGFGYAF